MFRQVKRPTSNESLRVVHMFARKPYEQRKEIVQVWTQVYFFLTSLASN